MIIIQDNREKLDYQVETIREKARREMKFHHISQIDIARYCRIGQSKVSHQLSGKTDLSLELVLAVQNLTGAKLL